MEYAEGGTLLSLLESTTELAPLVMIEILLGVTSALE